MFLPRYYSIVSGVGEADFALLSFDSALAGAGIGDYNIVKVSSILPPNCKHQEIISLSKGSVLYAAYSTITVSGNDVGDTGVAVALPSSDNEIGVIFEHSSINGSEDAGVVASHMCKVAMENRCILIGRIIKASQSAKAIEKTFATAISAVVMW